MPVIDLDTLNELLDNTANKLTEERDHAASEEWYEKAAKLDNVLEGVRKARFIANSGDCHVVSP
ncbi:MAG: hypothetical protein QM500_12190 [Methylococcales bacterium]